MYELTAGKMAALLARMKSGDLYDVFQLLTTKEYDEEILRLAFVIYGAMNRKDWRTITLDDIDFDINELKNSLVPMLRDTMLRDEELNVWGECLVFGCRAAMGYVLPLKDQEMEFLDRLNGHGEIAAKLLAEDEELADKIERHPMLLWKALNVKNYKGE